MILRLTPEIKSLIEDARVLNDKFLGVKFLSLSEEEEQNRLAALIAEHSSVMTKLGYYFFRIYQKQLEIR